jgi:hypothetical protein
VASDQPNSFPRPWPPAGLAHLHFTLLSTKSTEAAATVYPGRAAPRACSPSAPIEPLPPPLPGVGTTASSPLQETDAPVAFHHHHHFTPSPVTNAIMVLPHRPSLPPLELLLGPYIRRLSSASLPRTNPRSPSPLSESEHTSDWSPNHRVHPSRYLANSSPHADR